MKKETGIIKDDINFLEYPNWIVGKRNNYKIYMIEKRNGKYLISTTEDIDRLPDKADKIILYYLLKIILPTNSNKLETTRYNILKNSIGRTSKKEYEKLIDSLERWLALKIKFEGVFYEGDKYTTRGFHILDGYKLDEDSRLEIYFNEQYLEQLRNTNYFKLINFDEYKRLKRPVSARLYEILIKTFKDRDTWQIGIIKLAEKLTLEKREGKENYYPSDVIIKLIPAVNEINKRTGLKIHLHYNKETHVCTFTKVKQSDSPRSQDKPQEVSLPHKDDRFTALTGLLPKEHEGKKTILEALHRAYQKHGFDYVARNIRYANRYCKGNYRAYLSRSLKEDWGLALEEDEKRHRKLSEEEEQRREEEKQKKREERLRCDYECYVRDEALRYRNDLSPDEIELIEEEARLRVEGKHPNEDFTFNALLKFEIEDFLAEQAGALSFEQWKKHLPLSH
jgi:hypothetical protein